MDAQWEDSEIYRRYITAKGRNLEREREKGDVLFRHVWRSRGRLPIQPQSPNQPQE